MVLKSLSYPKKLLQKLAFLKRNYYELDITRLKISKILFGIESYLQYFIIKIRL